ncbi:MAG: hypothetical protein M1812_007757 [Candelaria pacifica]|nr:MAG: hypothetical protein M1812_007757 [Candelaria pacifica]
MAAARTRFLSKRGSPSFYATHRTMITIKVGPKAHPFMIHKELLCHYSSYFRAALMGSFREAAEGIVTLPDDEVEMFEYFMHWLYTKKLADEEADELPLGSNELIEIYLFADKRGVPSLMNKVVDMIMATVPFVGGVPAFNAVDLVYENTASNSLLRKLFVDLYAYDIDVDTLPDLSKPGTTTESLFLGRPKEFLVGIALANVRRLPFRLRDEKAPFELDISQYYEQDLCLLSPVLGTP